VIQTAATPRSSASFFAPPSNITNGSPLSFRRTSISFHPIAFPIPVPNAFETASFAAKRAAKWRAGNFIDCEYSISPGVKTRLRKRSPNR